MTRRVLVMGGVILAGLVSVAGAADPARPNILMIVSDNQWYDELGCYGHKQIHSPRIDRLAAEGVRLTDFHVASSLCTPSRGAFLTGRYPLRNGLYEMIRNDMIEYGHRYDEDEYAISPEMTLGLDLRETVIARPLKDAGYVCGAIGKWDSGRARRFLPLQRGFDYFYGFANTGIDYWTHERYGIPSLFRNNERIKEEGYATDLFCREALSFIKQNRDRPFFLYVPFNAPHGGSNLDRPGPQAPEETLSLYPNTIPAKQKAKFAAITRLDQSIGKILDLLDSLKLADNTFVLFFSDNGRQPNLHEVGVRTPCIARWPGHIPAGRTSNDFVSSLEIFPTLLAVAGLKPPKDVTLDGFNMLPVLEGKQPSAREDMFWVEQKLQAARVGSYKWISSKDGDELYNLAQDPDEKHNLAAKQPETVEKLKTRFESWKKEMDTTEPRGPFRDY